MVDYGYAAEVGLKVNKLGYAFRQERAVWIWRYIGLLIIVSFIADRINQKWLEQTNK